MLLKTSWVWFPWLFLQEVGATFTVGETEGKQLAYSGRAEESENPGRAPSSSVA